MKYRESEVLAGRTLRPQSFLLYRSMGELRMIKKDVVYLGFELAIRVA